MPRKLVYGAILPGLVVLSFAAGLAHAAAKAASPIALTGQVSSQEEGRMEGVLVSAKKEGSTVTVSVVTDQLGRYSFPAARLEPGRSMLELVPAVLGTNAGLIGAGFVAYGALEPAS